MMKREGRSSGHVHLRALSAWVTNGSSCCFALTHGIYVLRHGCPVAYTRYVCFMSVQYGMIILWPYATLLAYRGSRGISVYDLTDPQEGAVIWYRDVWAWKEPQEQVWLILIFIFYEAYLIANFNNSNIATMSIDQSVQRKTLWFWQVTISKKSSIALTLCLFHMNVFKGAWQWSVYPQRTESTYRRIWQPHVCWYSFTDLGRMESWVNSAGKNVTQIFTPRWGRGFNLGPWGWEAEILALCQPLPYVGWTLESPARNCECFWFQSGETILSRVVDVAEAVLADLMAGAQTYNKVFARSAHDRSTATLSLRIYSAAVWELDTLFKHDGYSSIAGGVVYPQLSLILPDYSGEFLSSWWEIPGILSIVWAFIRSAH